MNIKTKLTLGAGFFFGLILLLSAVGTRSINALRNDTRNILTANYNTLEYARNMLTALDKMNADAESALSDFEKNLNLQKGNVTEPGESEATTQIENHFNLLKKNLPDSALHASIRADISRIMMLNMNAIRRKSDIANQTAETANTWIMISSTLCFVLGMTLFVNLPGSIADPVRQLTASIREISAGNYLQRVYFKGKNEFGQLADSFNSMAEKLEEYNSSNLSKILIEKKRIETLINNMHEPVIGLDENQQVLFVNDEAIKITGIRKEEAIGKPVNELANANDLIRSLTSDLLDPAAVRKAQSLKIYADGKESYFEKDIINITITPTGENTRRLIGQVILLKNITPFKELDFAKSNFIATVSHELKTPIASIKMSLQLLKNQTTGILNADQAQLVDGIYDDSERLLKITGELLNMSQVETGNIQLNVQTVRPESILDYAIEAVKIQSEQKQIAMVILNEESLPGVRADQEKTAWVLINFLTNAIRYSQPGSKIRIHTRRDHDSVRFAVTDEGKGIDSRYTNKIFERYFQVPGSPKTGTGLGLAISKEFIEAQGGLIGVESEIGMGSTFYFSLSIA